MGSRGGRFSCLLFAGEENIRPPARRMPIAREVASHGGLPEVWARRFRDSLILAAHI